MLQDRVIDSIRHAAEIRGALDDAATHFYIDTSFALAACTLNPSAREQLFKWLKEREKRVHIPAWVAHELHEKITNEKGLKPMTAEVGGATGALATLLAETRRFVDEARALRFVPMQGQPAKGRVGFLADLEDEVRILSRRLLSLKSQAADLVDETAKVIVALVEGRVLNSDIYHDLGSLDARHAARVVGRQPPGTSDAKKDENKYGDLITWSEVVAHAADPSIRAVVLLSNDNKKDWVYSPSSILVTGPKQIANPSDRGRRVVKPLPLLLHELRRRNPDVALHVVNIAFLAHLLHATVGTPYRSFYEAYGPDDARTEGAVGDGEGTAAMEGVAGAVDVGDTARPTVALPELVRRMNSTDPDSLRSAAVAARIAWMGQGFGPGDAELANAVVEAADASEEVAVLLRDLLGGDLVGIRDPAPVLTESVQSVYYKPNGDLRDRPLREGNMALFELEREERLSEALGSLEARLGPVAGNLLLLPRVSGTPLEVQLRASNAGLPRRVNGVFHRDRTLTEDTARNSPRNVRHIAQADVVTVDGLLKLVADHFRVPSTKLTYNGLKSERVTIDPLMGFIEWNLHDGIKLR